MKKINIENKEISVRLSGNENDYISLTDIARFKDNKRTDYIIQNWMRTRDTVEFLGIWEHINNSDFKPIEFDGFRKSAGLNSFSLTPKLWIRSTNAIGLISRSGNNGGTFAHKDIAFEFATWISPEFKLYLIKEFQRLKVEENQRLTLGWDAKRSLTKINYRIHADSVKENIILPNRLSKNEAGEIYANEADLLNKVLFGMTAQEWRIKNKSKEGNMRDYADVYQLICLANLETLNAEFIKMNMSQKDRILRLNEIAISQMKSLQANNTVKKLK